MSAPQTIHFSIIIPCLNEADNLQELLPLLKGLFQGVAHELIVVDGGSTDLSRMICLQNEATFIRATRGRAYQLNAGAQLANGNYFYFLHADTRPPADVLKWLKKAEEKSLPAACFRLTFDDRQPFLRLLGWFTRFDLNCFRFGDQSLLVAADHFRKVGGYDESMALMEDNDLVVRLKQQGRFVIFPEAVTSSARKYQQHGAIYLQAVYVLIYLLGQWGVTQAKLVQLYRRALRAKN